MIPKFRAYWIKEKRWFRDDIIITDDGHMWNIVNGELYDMFDRDVENGRLSLMQSTGLTDGVGMDIFEGDIIETTDTRTDEPYGKRILEVRREKGSYVLYQKGMYSDYLYSPLRMEVYEVRVIGNIYDHPHLLEGGF